MSESLSVEFLKKKKPPGTESLPCFLILAEKFEKINDFL